MPHPLQGTSDDWKGCCISRRQPLLETFDQNPILRLKFRERNIITHSPITLSCFSNFSRLVGLVLCNQYLPCACCYDCSKAQVVNDWPRGHLLLKMATQWYRGYTTRPYGVGAYEKVEVQSDTGEVGMISRFCMPVADSVSQKFEHFHIPIGECFCCIPTAVNPDGSHTLCTTTVSTVCSST